MIDVLKLIWKPAVEILILAVGIYYILRFVWGTRGFSILTGFLVVLLTLALITSFFELTVLRWLLTTFSAFFAVAVSILYSPLGMAGAVGLHFAGDLFPVLDLSLAMRRSWGSWRAALTLQRSRARLAGGG